MREELMKIIKEVVDNFGEDILEIGEFRGQSFIILSKKERLRELIAYLKDRGFNHLQTLTAVDYLNQRITPRFEVVYQFCHLGERLQLRVRVQLEEDDPEIDSIVALYPSANFLEREVYDLFGINFKGHPNLKRILLPETWEGHPLRKDYPLSPEEKPADFLTLTEIKERLAKDGIR